MHYTFWKLQSWSFFERSGLASFTCSCMSTCLNLKRNRLTGVSFAALAKERA